jgi:hypothetical protein
MTAKGDEHPTASGLSNVPGVPSFSCNDWEEHPLLFYSASSHPGARSMNITDLSAQTVPRVTKSTRDTIDQLCVNTIRTLAMDAVQSANSGHPGTPMALAPVVYCLWQRVLRFDPNHPIWPNRDRFVLSAGHASMLLYAMLHLSGVHATSNSGIRARTRARV